MVFEKFMDSLSEVLSCNSIGAGLSLDVLDILLPIFRGAKMPRTGLAVIYSQRCIVALNFSG